MISLASVGSLLLNGNPVSLNKEISVAQISDGQLTFMPMAGQSGNPYDSFNFEVGDGINFSVTDYMLTINVMLVTSANEEIVPITFKVYPNPSEIGSSFKASIPLLKGPSAIKLLSLEGKVIWEQSLTEGPARVLEISVVKAASGFYLLWLKDSNFSSVQKVLIK